MLGARNGLRMDEGPVGPRQKVAGGPLRSKHEKQGTGDWTEKGEWPEPHKGPRRLGGPGRSKGEGGGGGKGATCARRTKRSPDGWGSRGHAPQGCWRPAGV